MEGAYQGGAVESTSYRRLSKTVPANHRRTSRFCNVSRESASGSAAGPRRSHRNDQNSSSARHPIKGSEILCNLITNYKATSYSALFDRCTAAEWGSVLNKYQQSYVLNNEINSAHFLVRKTKISCRKTG